MLYKRLEHDEKKGKENIQWTDYNFEVLLTYNNKMVHSTTGYTPQEARKKGNELNIALNISMKAKKNRKYPELEVGSKVKILRKKGITEKERTSHWTKQTYKIAKIEKKLGQEYYYIENYDRAFLRHELLKV